MSRLTIHELTKAFMAFVAVKDVNLEVADGEFLSLLGPSGCGKTTTLRCVAGLEDPTSGKILFGDKDVTHLPPERRHIGMVFQNYALFPHMTVVENVKFGLDMKGITGAEAQRRMTSVMEMVQLSHLQDRHPRQLSGGQQQRVALARALVIEPTLLLLDEPLANLDAKLREEMRFFIRSLQQRVGITTLYVTHDQAESMTMSDRIVVMFGGYIHQVGSPQDIYFRPATKEVANFIGHSNLLPGKVLDEHDGIVSVQTAFGVVQSRALQKWKSGSPVTVMVRPETLRLTAGSYPNALPGRIVAQHFLGNIVDYRVALADDTMVMIQSLGGQTHATGDAINVIVDPEKTWLLP